jgi:hypothetical protein
MCAKPRLVFPLLKLMLAITPIFWPPPEAQLTTCLVMELDASTLATTSTLVFRVLGIAPAIDNAAGDVAKVIVAINVHQLKAGAAGV